MNTIPVAHVPSSHLQHHRWRLQEGWGGKAEGGRSQHIFCGLRTSVRALFEVGHLEFTNTHTLPFQALLHAAFLLSLILELILHSSLNHFRIMMLSVLRHTKTPVKFWFLKNYLSPSFKVLPLSFCYSCLENKRSFRALFRLSKGIIWGLFPFCNSLSVLWPFYACNIMSGTHKITSIIFVLLDRIV